MESYHPASATALRKADASGTAGDHLIDALQQAQNTPLSKCQTAITAFYKHAEKKPKKVLQ